MQIVETDYLIVGAGAVGLAFADQLLTETDARILLVDRRGLPGGHWNDAYPFVALHQPSAFYGVPSLPLGSGAVERHGPNAGFLELAGGAEVQAHFQRALQQRLLPSGRVVWRPMSEHRVQGGAHRVVSLLGADEIEVRVRRRVVDATFLGTQVPATHTPRFAIAPGTRVVPPNALPGLWHDPGGPPAHLVVLGGGKTAMDVVGWLLGAGTPAGRIHWVRPRESWLIDRASVQPTMAHFERTFAAQVALVEGLAEDPDADTLFERLEAAGGMLRIEPRERPTMFHYATISAGEIAELRRVGQVLRQGRVTAVEPGALHVGEHRVAVPAGSLFVDCTASAVERRAPVPVFQPGRIVLQMVRVPQPTFSAALLAHLEALELDDDARNAMARAVPLPDGVADYPRASLVGLLNQQRWTQDAGLRAWIRDCRLDGFGRLVREVDPSDAGKIALLARMKAAAPRVAAAAPRWFAPGR